MPANRQAVLKKTAVNTVSVIHLIWLPLGTVPFSNFLSSYCKYKSGHPHELVLLFNGVSTEEDLSPFLNIIDGKRIPYRSIIHYGWSQDLDAYFWVANLLNSTHLLFLNSYSELLADGWLEKYMQPAKDPRVGIIGATGSWQSYYRTVFINNNWKWEKTKSTHDNIRKFKLLIKAAIYWRLLFPDFPNPHIRTNAFMVQRELLISLKKKTRLKNKLAALALENGRRSITNQLYKRGYEAIVIDRWGGSFKKREWMQSKVFWIEEQQNLLVSDNQTKKYRDGDQDTRKKLSFLAWGNHDNQPL